MIRVAVVGAGAWGSNHVRTFARSKQAQLVMVCDPSSAAQQRARQLAPEAAIGADLRDALRSNADAIVIATPAVCHAEHALAALEAGKHVLVEKPLALTTADAERVVAAAGDRTLMVGHLMLHHPAFVRLEQLIASGELGKIYYLYGLRVNLGRLRRDENCMQSLAPHDVSMILQLVGLLPESVSARGGAYLQPNIPDVCFLNLRFPNDVLAQVQVSWLDPRKERRLTVVGAQKMVEFDDAHPVEKLRIYDKGYDAPPTFTEYAEYLSIRNGDITIPRVEMTEPLELEARHFLECIETGAVPRTDGRSSIDVVRVLEAAQSSLEADGAPVRL